MRFSMSIYNKIYVNSLKNNKNKVKRVEVIHHIRNVNIDKFLKKASDFINDGNIDEYSFRCQNILNNTAEEFLDYMWNPTNKSKFEQEKKQGFSIAKKINNNFYLTKNPGEATIIFTSLTNKDQLTFVNKANIWGKNFNIKFFSINGVETNTACAEIYAKGIIKNYNDFHCVFITANMAARSFSVPKIVNGIMMVNEPGIATAEQKYNRLSTIDWNNLNKIAHMYWFNFKAMSAVCPLYTMVYEDLLMCKDKKDQHNKYIKTMLDTINIFIQNDEDQNENLTKWTETKLLEKINRGTIDHDTVTALTINHCDGLEQMVAELVSSLKLNDFNLKTDKIGKTMQKKINAGKQAKRTTIDNGEPDVTDSDPKTKKVQLLNIEIAVKMVSLTLGHDKEDRDFDNFACDCNYIFTSEGVKKIGKSNLQKLWKLIETKIAPLAFNV